MNADQVIKGIGNAVAAAQPAQEYCLFWSDYWWLCMTKSEWSGWVQAVGSVIAIICAFGIAWWQWSKLNSSEIQRKSDLANIIGREVLSVIQEQISILEKIDKVFMHAKSIGGLQDMNTDFIKWCIEQLPTYDVLYLNELLAINNRSISALAQARGSIRQIKKIGLSEKFAFPAIITFLIPPIKTGLDCLYIGRDGLHDFLKINADMSPMYKFGQNND